MSMESLNFSGIRALLPAFALVISATASAQVPVDENGDPIAQFDASGSTAAETADQIPLLSAAELEELVGPYALYPDDLLAIVLPASTYPLQLVQAQRFLEDLEKDPTLKPDESWDDSVVALVNYPEAVELMTRDLDKTWRLGEAVVAQQADVIAAVESFRDRAYAAGNLTSDSYQTVSQDDGVIEITPVEDDVIYVPYYEPARVVVYQPRPVYYYHPRPYPVYYYPYPYGYSFYNGYFWGVTTAFTVGWYTNHLHVYHHSYHGHPYHDRHYRRHHWYRRPSIHVHNNYYYNTNFVRDRYSHGDYWRPRTRHTVNPRNHRVTRSRYYPGTNTPVASSQDRNSQGGTLQRHKSSPTASSKSGNRRDQEINFRPRTSRSKPVAAARPNQQRKPGQSVRSSNSKPAATRSNPTRVSKSTRSRQPDQDIRFKPRASTAKQVASLRPGSSAGRSSAPRVSQPKASKPTISRPKRSSPTVNHSKSGAPTVSRPRASNPTISRPKSSSPTISRPQHRAPKTSQARVSQSRPSGSSAKSSGSRKVASASGNRRKSESTARRRR